MGPFWDSWQLWEKMCFVLGCAIVVTVVIGICRLTYERWRLRKFIKVAAQQAEEGTAPPMEQKRRGRADGDVPFGVRAIESGVEVEGVWISRGNSPATSVASSPATRPQEFVSAKSLNASRTSIPAITMPKPVHPYSSQASDSSASEPPSPGRSPESSRRTSRNVSPSGHYRDNSRHAYKPRQSSHLRYSSGFYGLEQASAQAEAPNSDNTSQFNRSPSGSSTDSSESVHSRRVPHHYQPRRQPSYTSAASPPVIDARRSEIDLMPFTSRTGVGVDLHALASHRRSQAAETGQLLPPRSRNSSAEWSSARSLSRQSVVEESEEPSTTAPAPHTSDAPTTHVSTSSSQQNVEGPSRPAASQTDPTGTDKRSVKSFEEVQGASHDGVPDIRIGSYEFMPHAGNSTSQSTLKLHVPRGDKGEQSSTDTHPRV